MPTGQTSTSSISLKKIHFGSLILIGSTHKFSAIFSIISSRPGLYRILGTITIILLPAILLNKRLPLHPISVDWIYKNMIYFISTTTPPLPSLKNRSNTNILTKIHVYRIYWNKRLILKIFTRGVASFSTTCRPVWLSFRHTLKFFKGPFWGAYIRRGLCAEGNLRLKIDWASLILGRKFTVTNFALRVSGAYIWRGLFSEFYGILKIGRLTRMLWPHQHFELIYSV